MTTIDNTSSLVIDIRNAAYGEINHLRELYARASSLEDALPLMNSDIIYNAINSTIHKLVKLSLFYCENIYDYYIYNHFHKDLLDYKIDLRAIDIFQQDIIGDIKSQLERELQFYSNTYQNFIGLLSQYNQNYANSSYNAEITGAFIGATFLGPLGAVIGGMAGNYINNQSLQEQMQEKSKNFCKNFTQLLDNLIQFLQTMAINAHQIIVNYSNHLLTITKKINYATYHCEPSDLDDFDTIPF